jgi:glycosyltransferase involved in cell wall biosynthesis
LDQVRLSETLPAMVPGVGGRIVRTSAASPETGARSPRVLISTISPVSGGVPTMTRFIVQTLRVQGFTPVLVHYEPYSVAPAMSVPFIRLLGGRIGHETRNRLDDCETHAIGAWLPEFEVTHYLATECWRRLIDSAQAYIVVSGNALGALPFYQTNRPFLAWLASGWNADREHRVRKFSAARTFLDRAVVRPAAQRLERVLLARGAILALSQYTRNTLDAIAGRPVVREVLPMPIDTDFFSPQLESRVRGRIGFSGRFEDPRKNIELLFDALSIVRKRGHQVSALLIGGEPSAAIVAQIGSRGIDRDIEFRSYGPREAVRTYLRTLDLFVVPSHQEGLCIAALEAMACGIPVVSTRCGGPEEFVVDEETGRLVGFDALEMADAIVSILRDRARREQLGDGARDMVLQRYSAARAESVFWGEFNRTFPNLTKAMA